MAPTKIEILAGDKFANAVRELNLASAQCAYQHEPKQKRWCEKYQVWELSQEDFDKICSLNEADWKDTWGWWRYSDGSNLGSVNHEFVVHGEKILAWDGYKQLDFETECAISCSDRKRGLCKGTEEDFEACFGKREYPDIITYLCDEVGASTEKNVCACTVDLARQNNMTLSQLFKKYLG